MLCHGQPTLDNILFLYDDKGTPVDAKVNKFNFPNHQTLQLYQFQFVNFSNCRIATPMSDFLVFTNSNAADQSREDFMLRFVHNYTSNFLIFMFSYQVCLLRELGKHSEAARCQE